jgi:cell division protein FtsI/penicillin-binding protein 2
LVGAVLLAATLASPDGGMGGSAAAEAARATGAGSRAASAPRTPPPDNQPDPRRGLDLAALVVEQGRLVQHVEDRTIVTTLDPELQRFAERLLRSYAVPDGAAVAINSRTGEVLVLAQHSERDPGSLVALAANAPAASMFKVVTAAAILDSTEIAPDSEFCYHGGARGIDATLLAPDPTRDVLCSSFGAALGRSINVIFARLADEHLSAIDLERYARGFGFNRELAFDLPLSMAQADVPEDRLERARMAAGFWHTRLSPLHAALMAQAVAQDGAMLQPYLVDTVRDAAGRVVYDAGPVFIDQACRPETARELARMMVSTTTAGTARTSFHRTDGEPVIADVEVAGKTGTLHGQNPYRAYDWFMGFAPAADPEIAVAALVVNDPLWRIKGHFVAREILREYFSRASRGSSGRSEPPSQATP